MDSAAFARLSTSPSRSVRSIANSAIAPITTLNNVTATYMPMLNASRRALEAWPCRIRTRKPCFVPAPPGEIGRSVERLSTTWASSALWTVAWMWNAFRNQYSEAIRDTQLASCQLTTSRA